MLGEKPIDEITNLRVGHMNTLGYGMDKRKPPMTIQTTPKMMGVSCKACDIRIRLDKASSLKGLFPKFIARLVKDSSAMLKTLMGERYSRSRNSSCSYQ